ncbi:MAG: hypothetical protein KDK78_09705, partial [Chlamydiia bacterium]|nr:hypothetical protein [Chlamydiia bacterium]
TLGRSSDYLPYQPPKRFKCVLADTYYELLISELQQYWTTLSSLQVTEDTPTFETLNELRLKGSAAAVIQKGMEKAQLALHYLELNVNGNLQQRCLSLCPDDQATIEGLRRISMRPLPLWCFLPGWITASAGDFPALSGIPNASLVKRPDSISSVKTVLVSKDNLPFAVLIPVLKNTMFLHRLVEGSSSIDQMSQSLIEQLKNSGVSDGSLSGSFVQHRYDLTNPFPSRPPLHPDLWVLSQSGDLEIHAYGSGKVDTFFKGVRQSGVPHMTRKRAHIVDRAFGLTNPKHDTMRHSLAPNTAADKILGPLLDDDSLQPFIKNGLVVFEGHSASPESVKLNLSTALNSIQSGSIFGAANESTDLQALQNSILCLAELLPQKPPETRIHHLLRLAFSHDLCMNGITDVVRDIVVEVTGQLSSQDEQTPALQILLWWDQCKELIVEHLTRIATWRSNDPYIQAQDRHLLNGIRAAMAGELCDLHTDVRQGPGNTGIAFPSIERDAFAADLLYRSFNRLSSNTHIREEELARGLSQIEQRYQKQGRNWLENRFPTFLQQRVNEVLSNAHTGGKSGLLMNNWVRALANHFFIADLPKPPECPIAMAVHSAESSAAEKSSTIQANALQAQWLQTSLDQTKNAIEHLSNYSNLGKRKREESSDGIPSKLRSTGSDF